MASIVQRKWAVSESQSTMTTRLTRSTNAGKQPQENPPLLSQIVHSEGNTMILPVLTA